MKELSREELEPLLESGDGPRVSLYSPMVRKGIEVQQNPIRLKNLLRRAGESLEEHGLTAAATQQLLAPVAELAADRFFWEHQDQGLAIFLSDGFFRHYRLPHQPPELALVERRFHLKPLLPALTGDGRYYVLALSQKRARLLEARRDGVRELELIDVPTSLNEAVGYEVEQRHLQFHTGTPRQSGNVTRSAIFHGHGGGEDDVKLEIRKFFGLLAEGVRSRATDPKAPVVLAGVEYLFPLYRRASNDPRLLAEGLPGNPDELSAETLRDRAWELVEPIFARQRRDAEARFHELLGTGQASAQLHEVVTAAHDGRVDTLFVALDTQRWGEFDAETRSIEPAEGPGPGRADLLDLAALQTLAKGGTVFAVAPEEVPERGDVAAVFRY